MNKELIYYEAKLTNMIYQVVQFFGTMSLTKCIFSTFCLKNCLSAGDNLGHVKYEVFGFVLERLRSALLLKEEDLTEIIKCIDILCKTNYLKIYGKNISITSKSLATVNCFEQKQKKILDDIKNMNDNWFIEEIINYV